MNLTRPAMFTLLSDLSGSILRPFKKPSAHTFLSRGLVYSLTALFVFIPISKAGVEISFGFAFVFFVLKKVFRPEHRFLSMPYHWPLLAFAAFSAASIAQSAPYQHMSFLTFLNKWCENMMIFLMAEDAFADPKLLHKAFWAMMTVAFVLCLDALSQRFLGLEFFRGRELVRLDQVFTGGHYLPTQYAVTGAYEHYNPFGTYLLTMALMALPALLLGSYSMRLRWFLGILCMGLVSCLYLTFSRGAWVAFGLCLAVIAAVSRRFWGVVLLLLLLAPVLTVPAVTDRFLYTILSDFGQSDRFAVWGLAWQMIKESPWLGKGVGTFMEYCNLYSGGHFIRYAHNCYLQIAAETGIPSLISFVFFLGLLGVRCWRSYLSKRSPLILAMFMAGLGIAIHAGLDTQLYSLQTGALAWAVWGLAGASAISFERASSADPPNPSG